MASYYELNSPRRERQTGRQKIDLAPRFYIYLGAAALGILAVILTLTLSASLFGKPDIASPVGDFFTDSYGMLSFIIPTYLVLAALILLDASFRPRLIFLMNSIVFPFLTLSVSFSFLRDFNYYAQEMAFFRAIGKNGFSFFTVAFTMIECFVLVSLSSLFFPATPIRKPIRAAAKQPEAADDVKIVRIPIQPINAGEEQTSKKISEGAMIFEEPTIDDMRLEYSAAFEELGKFDNFHPFEKLDNNLEMLNSKLSSLGSDFGVMDYKFDKLNSNINNLNSELCALGIESHTKDNINNIEDAQIIDSEDLNVNIDPLCYHDETNVTESNYDSSRDDENELEQIIGEAEAMAAKKTEEVLKYHNETYQKKKPEFKIGSQYGIPVDGILQEYTDDEYWIIDEETKKAAIVLTETLSEFNIKADVTGIRKGPVITSFEILPSPGVKLSKIVNLQDNIALRLAAASVRIVAPIPGKHAVGIEIPNKKRNIVSFHEIIEGQLKNNNKKAEIPVILGKDITGEAVTVDLATMPHLLIAGSTGSGKSVCVNTLILSILYQCTPSKCKLILIDPKIVELKLYNDIPHLLTPVITEPKRAFQALQYCIFEMERRYACLDSMGVRDIKTYNKRIKERGIAAEHMPYIVVVIDEFADLMATTGKELESTVARLAAMSRAVGIHLVLATQRPSIDVITGLIKSNIPSRIAFMVASMMDSRIIIDMPGAEKLLGKGDMLYSGIVDPFPVRLQGAFVSEDEVERVVEYVKGFGEPQYIDEEIFFDEDNDEFSDNLVECGNDPLYEKAMEVVVQQGKASASYIQRRLKIGYNRAARLVEEMETRGIVGPAQGSRPRELLRAV
jgi:S-DNA-T family DNA segregation ATPase FtsK/SpoIIIE